MNMLPGIISTAFSMFLAVASWGSESQNPPRILIHTAQCLVAKRFITDTDKGPMTFGYFIDEQSYPGDRVIYVVEHTGQQDGSHATGRVFSVFFNGKTGHEKYDIQNNARFTISKNEIEFNDPPLGGIWTQEHLITAIKIIAKSTKFVVSDKTLATADPAVLCESYVDHRKK
jgi:hypothetical protein